jgi:hypothetical protein
MASTGDVDPPVVLRIAVASRVDSSSLLSPCTRLVDAPLSSSPMQLNIEYHYRRCHSFNSIYQEIIPFYGDMEFFVVQLKLAITAYVEIVFRSHDTDRLEYDGFVLGAYVFIRDLAGRKAGEHFK